MQLNPYLIFDGRCEAAFKRYAEVLGGEIVALSRYGESPGCEQMPPEARDLVIHVRLVVDGQVLMGSDSPPGRYEGTKGMSVAINVDDTTEGERIFNARAEGGRLRMAFEETFWAKGFGMCVDRYGTPWMVNAGMKD